MNAAMAEGVSFYTGLGLSQVINAAGKMTALGASTLAPDVTAAIAEAATRCIDMDELFSLAGQRIAAATGAEAGFITSSAAAGIAITAAACISRGDRARAGEIPNPGSPPEEILLQRGHAVNFGAPITQILRLGGARVVEIGDESGTTAQEFAAAFGEQTAGVMHVISHHALAMPALSLEEILEIAHSRGVPVIVDAAAELDLRAFIQAGADLVIYSGHKAIGGPTSGLVAGRADLIEACQVQNRGIGRAMKIGKEAVVGLLAALEAHAHGETAGPGRAPWEPLETALEGLPGLTTRLVQDPTRPSITRLRLELDPNAAAIKADELVRRLVAHSPSIRTRNHHAAHGQIDVDFRMLQAGEAQVIAAAICHHLTIR